MYSIQSKSSRFLASTQVTCTVGLQKRWGAGWSARPRFLTQGPIAKTPEETTKHPKKSPKNTSPERSLWLFVQKIAGLSVVSISINPFQVVDKDRFPSNELDLNLLDSSKAWESPPRVCKSLILLGFFAGVFSGFCSFQWFFGWFSMVLQTSGNFR